MTEKQTDKTAASGKIMYQSVMNYKAYRRRMVTVRLGLTLAVAGAFCVLCAVSVVLGIVLSVSALCIGIILILAGMAAEQTYTVYDTHIVIKRRGRDKRVFINADSITDVSYRSAFYEKGLATGTVTITAKTGKRSKKYKLRHIFDAAPIVGYLQESIRERNNTDENRE